MAKAVQGKRYRMVFFKRLLRSLARVADQRKQAKEMRRAAAAQAGIVQVLQELPSLNSDLQTVMNLMAERARGLTGASGALIELIEEDHMVCRATAGIGIDRAELRLKRRGSLAGDTVHSGTVSYSEDCEADERVDRAVCRRMGTRSIIAAPLRAADQVIGVLKVLSDRPRAFTQRDVSNLQILVASLGAIIQRHRDGEQLRASEAQYRMLFDINPHPMWVYEETNLRMLAVNRAAVEHYGYSEQEFLSMTLRDFRCEEDAGENGKTAGTLPERRAPGPCRHWKKDGSLIEVEVVDQGIDFNGRPARLALANDVTERLRTERELARLSRAQQMLSACNEALIRIEEESALLETICRICVEIGGYRMTWVGFAQEDAGKSILPVAQAGEHVDYLEGIRLTWSGDSSIGQGPAGRSIRTNEAVIVADLSGDKSFKAWLARALERGFRSVTCLPLRGKERAFGVLALYGPEVAHVSADEIKLLQALADNLAFGIANIRSQHERRQLQLAAVKVAAGVSASTGTEFFKQLAVNMAEAVGADAGFVAQLLPGEPLTARTIAAVVDGKVQPNFDYAVEDTPCGNLLTTVDWAMPDRMDTLFPRAPATCMKAYVGRRLDNSSGQPAGLLFVLFREPFGQSGNRSDFIVSVLRIFAARASAELERREADARIREQASLLDKAKDAIVVRGIDNRVQFWNKGAERLYGWSAAEAAGRSVEELLYHDADAYREATCSLMRDGEWSGEIRGRRKDGSVLMVEANWTLVRDECGRPQSIFGIKTDVTQRKAAEQEIQYLAYYDPLTGLPNRLLLMDRLQHALLASARNQREGALLFIDLDNFKTLNDTLGHHTGDLLLQQVAHRLTDCVRECDTVARLGGDEFVVMLEDFGDGVGEAGERANTVGEKILAALNQPFRLDGYEQHSTPSIGIALFDGLQHHVGELLKRADLAMYQAKAAGRNTLRFFDPGMQAAVFERAAMEADLRQGLRDNELLLHYQPQVDGGGRITGVEALVRWQHARRGMVPPTEFIGLAEETGLVLPLGQWVLQTACFQLAAWATRQETAHLYMAVNVSARQFRHPDFLGQVLAVLDETGADPHKLKLELTESVLVDNVEDTIAKMTALKAKGVGFSLDDFGTGYSSLAYLKRLPLDLLKIDRSFVNDVLTDPNDAAIARTVVALAQSLGLAVIAEGVETEAQRNFLARHGCHAYQGFLFSPPLSIGELEAFMREKGGLTRVAASAR